MPCRATTKHKNNSAMAMLVAPPVTRSRRLFRLRCAIPVNFISKKLPTVPPSDHQQPCTLLLRCFSVHGDTAGQIGEPDS